MRMLVSLASFILCGLAFSAQAGEGAPSLPSLALDPPALPSSPWSGLYAGSDNFAISADGKAGKSANNLFNSSGNAKAAGTLGAGFDALTNNLHVSLHMSGGAMGEATIRH